MTIDDRSEWLEADGLGGFASGTISGIRTRRYHALLLTATTPPTGRMVLVNGFDAWLTTAAGRVALSAQRYHPDVVHPDGYRQLASFVADPWPTWEFDTSDGVRIRQEVVVQHGAGVTLVTWRLLRGSGPVTLEVRPFFSGRDYHALHHENGAFGFAPETAVDTRVWSPYDGAPKVSVQSNADYTHAPEWYRNFLYATERERGLDAREDLASPGVFTWTLESPSAEGVLILRALSAPAPATDPDALTCAALIRATERARRSAFATPLDRAADAYIVRRGSGQSIVAGYPWFTDWGRDTFIAIRGLCIAPGRLALARDILLEWSHAVSEGMLPNRFPDSGETAEFNAVDASLWFVIAVHDLFERAGRDLSTLSAADRARLQTALQIVDGYAAGTRYGIKADGDGLLRAGVPGVQLTWMDARIGDRVITPRVGKPVEVQALWLNALRIVAAFDPRWRALFERGRQSFADRFWNADRACLYDVVDVDHVAGACDATVRPNQILAVGGLPVSILDGERARSVVDLVERELLTPCGLRSLARFENGYAPHYLGGPDERDGVYHQGTVWPWLLGPFVDAWIAVRGDTSRVRATARKRFVTPLLADVLKSGAGHLCEITDAEAPFTARGCSFQAWSLGELMRVCTRYGWHVPPRNTDEATPPTEQIIIDMTGASSHALPSRRRRACTPASASPVQRSTPAR
jgi:predicted glycogen debranching enzyme